MRRPRRSMSLGNYTRRTASRNRHARAGRQAWISSAGWVSDSTRSTSSERWWRCTDAAPAPLGQPSQRAWLMPTQAVACEGGDDAPRACMAVARTYTYTYTSSPCLCYTTAAILLLLYY